MSSGIAHLAFTGNFANLLLTGGLQLVVTCRPGFALRVVRC
jgi:hypothetical protein